MLAMVSGRCSDLEALRLATGDDTITWRDYKLGKYATVEQNIPSIIGLNVEEYINGLKEAMELDSQFNPNKLTITVQKRRELYFRLKRATDDFRTSIYEQDFTV